MGSDTFVNICISLYFTVLFCGKGGRMSKKVEVSTNLEKMVYTQPTMCLHCHLVVEFFHLKDEDEKTGNWTCPKCEYKFRISHWHMKINREKH